jgi:hypothetical protein
LTEVLCCAWDCVGVELEFDTAERLTTESDVEEDCGVFGGHCDDVKVAVMMANGLETL